MAMFIVKPWYGKKNPDDYFDPVTRIATEENFIKFLECGVYDSKYIGYKVQLSNSVDYNNGLWVIADVNHDSANTGQTNCYDLISEQSFSGQSFGTSTTYRSSLCTLRTWLTNTFYSGFSNDIKLHMLNIKYQSASSWYNDDKVILPSTKEIGIYDSSDANEGSLYPIFTDNNSRIKVSAVSGTYQTWFTRTRGTQWMVLTCNTSGVRGAAGYDWVNSVFTSPIIRVN